MVKTYLFLASIFSPRNSSGFLTTLSAKHQSFQQPGLTLLAYEAELLFLNNHWPHLVSKEYHILNTHEELILKYASELLPILTFVVMS